MNKNSFKLTSKDPKMIDLVGKTNHKILAKWAIMCAKRVLPYFEGRYPKDVRPKVALNTLQDWINTGKFSMKIIRKASLNSHAAARDVGIDTPARSVARACGQAVATAHVPRHACGSAIYAQQAVFRATNSFEEATKERNWQFEQLLKLYKFSVDKG